MLWCRLADALEDEGGDRQNEDIHFFDDSADSQGLGGKPAKGTVSPLPLTSLGLSLHDLYDHGVVSRADARMQKGLLSWRAGLLR